MQYKCKLSSITQLIDAVLHRTLSPEDINKEIVSEGSLIAKTLNIGFGMQRIYMLNAWEALGMSCLETSWRDLGGEWHFSTLSDVQRWFMIQSSMLEFIRERDKCIHMDALMALSVEEIIEGIPQEVICPVRVGTEQGSPGSFTLSGPNNKVYVNSEQRLTNRFPEEWVWTRTTEKVRDQWGPADRIGADANPSLKEVAQWLTAEGTYRFNAKEKLCELLA